MKTRRIKVIKKGHFGTKKKAKKKTKKRVYNATDYKSGEGMLTSVWGPGLWHYLHTMSFNYPDCPTQADKTKYRNFIMSMKTILPCKYCRINMGKNLKAIPLNRKALKNRTNFSKWMFRLHEHVNKMLKKKSGLKYHQVRETYENFRSRCTLDIDKLKKKENGCIVPLYGKKSKCLIRIVPKENREITLKIDKKCIKRKN
jgi:hypothetical protein